MKTVVVDTNAYLRFLLNDVPEQKRQFEKILEQAKLAKIAIYSPQIVIFEIEYGLRKYYHFPKETTIEKLESIINTRYINLQDRDRFKKAIKIFKENNLSLADCFIFAYSQDKNSDLFTFDKALKKLKS